LPLVSAQLLNEIQRTYLSLNAWQTYSEGKLFSQSSLFRRLKQSVREMSEKREEERAKKEEKKATQEEHENKKQEKMKIREKQEEKKKRDLEKLEKAEKVKCYQREEETLCQRTCCSARWTMPTLNPVVRITTAPPVDTISSQAKDLITRLLKASQEERISADEISGFRIIRRANAVMATYLIRTRLVLLRKINYLHLQSSLPISHRQVVKPKLPYVAWGLSALIILRKEFSLRLTLS